MAPTPSNEAARLAALQRYQILDTAPEPEFDDLAALAWHICGTSRALIGFVDRGRLWIKAKIGMDASEIPRDSALGAHVLMSRDVMVIPDTATHMASENGNGDFFVPDARFYAGAPLVTPDGFTVGVISVADTRPHQLTLEQSEALAVLSRQVVNQLEMRRKTIEFEAAVEGHGLAQRQMQEAYSALIEVFDTAVDAIFMIDEKGRIVSANRAMESMFGYTADEMSGRGVGILMPLPDANPHEKYLAGYIAGDETHVIGMPHREVMAMRADGSTFPIELSVSRVETHGTLRFTAVVRDITSRTRAAEAEGARVQRAEELVASIPSAIFATDTGGVVNLAQGGALESLGTTEVAAEGLEISEILGANSDVGDGLSAALSGETSVAELTVNGHVYETRFSPSVSLEGEAIGIDVIATDVTQTKEREATLERQAFFDSLTGLPNRAFFSSRLERVIKAIEQDGTLVAILFIDLDGFKEVNDEFGHAVGDELLCAVAGRLSESTRPGDMAARYGGDEFILVLEGVGSSEASAVANRAIRLFAEPFSINGYKLNVSASIGVAATDEAGLVSGSLLECADEALYQAKRAGKAQFAVFESTVDAGV